jgi:hypothetical protein
VRVPIVAGPMSDPSSSQTRRSSSARTIGWSRWLVASAFGGLAISSSESGCVDRDPARAMAYERCASDLAAAACSDGTHCLGVNPYGESVKDPGQICSEECLTANDCPSASGFEVACESFTIGRRCVLHCAAAPSSECPDDLYCAETARQNGEDVRLCL